MSVASQSKTDLPSDLAASSTTEGPSGLSSRTTVSLEAAAPLVSRWSPDTSSVATSSLTGAGEGPSGTQASRGSMASAGGASTGINSTSEGDATEPRESHERATRGHLRHWNTAGRPVRSLTGLRRILRGQCIRMQLRLKHLAVPVLQHGAEEDKFDLKFLIGL
ncbi:hypothetical protein L228DRAFT_244956 [Xylona heveae TC161]|uniref:Uncharacterized protein n=1 Tax=Xylona heveae (strain CBS 132557 / TC161) TaxID=1328760 RepID=A0A165HXZ8_XYLHT|nr:hypothetical protein L228DRAFT_244956 [Xylona heveae TC161]KZF24082.1 hypothetical protein L228DRAFT_244956 [Xylona heveae TC161]